MRVDRDVASRFVYSLEGPDGVVRYVGLTVDPETRLHQHRCSSPRNPFTKWLLRMKSTGCVVTMRILASLGACDRARGMRHERDWTERIRAMGAPLFNAEPRDKGPKWVVVRTAPAILASRSKPSRARKARASA